MTLRTTKRASDRLAGVVDTLLTKRKGFVVCLASRAANISNKESKEFKGRRIEGRRRVKRERCLNEIVAGGESTERPGSGQWERVVVYHCSLWMGSAGGSDQYETAVCQEISGLTETNLGKCCIFNIVFYLFIECFGGFRQEWWVYKKLECIQY